MDNWKLFPCCYLFVYLITTSFYFFSLLKLHNSSALKTQTQTFTREKTLNSQWGEIYIAIKTSLFSASNLFSFTLYLSDNKYGVVFIMHLLYICLGHMWWHICLNFSLFCLPTNVISDLSNICRLAKYSQIHDFIQWPVADPDLELKEEGGDGGGSVLFCLSASFSSFCKCFFYPK